MICFFCKYPTLQENCGFSHTKKGDYMMAWVNKPVSMVGTMLKIPKFV